MAETKTNQEMSIEETLEALEMIIEKMEDRDSSLEETFANYELGMKMVKSCSDQIDRVEKKIQVLAELTSEGIAAFDPYGQPLASRRERLSRAEALAFFSALEELAASYKKLML